MNHLDHIDALLRAASPGPWKMAVWRQHTEKKTTSLGTKDVLVPGGDGDMPRYETLDVAEVVSAFTYTPPQEKQIAAGTALIAAMRNLLPLYQRLARAAEELLARRGDTIAAYVEDADDAGRMSHCDDREREAEQKVRAALDALLAESGKETPDG